MILIIIALTILIAANSARKEIMVVMLPAPAIIGNAKGTMLAVFPVVLSLKSRTPRIISKLMANKIKDPATAKASTLTPKRLKILSPKIKKPIKIATETKLAFKA